jgi:hypothetical protein
MGISNRKVKFNVSMPTQPKYLTASPRCVATSSNFVHTIRRFVWIPAEAWLILSNKHGGEKVSIWKESVMVRFSPGAHESHGNPKQRQPPVRATKLFQASDMQGCLAIHGPLSHGTVGSVCSVGLACPKMFVFPSGFALICVSTRRLTLHSTRSTRSWIFLSIVRKHTAHFQFPSVSSKLPGPYSKRWHLMLVMQLTREN